MIEVPDVVSFGASEACAMITAAGLTPTGPDHTAAPTAGVVTAQHPEPATPAEPGQPVTLWTMGGHPADAPTTSPTSEPAIPEPA